MREDKRIEIYKGLEGEVIFDIDAEGETIWATQDQMAKIFSVDRTVVSRHIRNIFKDGELDEARVCAKNAHTGPDGKTYQVKMYNLDAIISVGYRVNSKKATNFRIWATKVLKKYVVSGVVVNENRLEALTERNEAKKLHDVEEMMGIIRRITARNELGAGEANGIIEVISKYAGSFEALKEYDSGRIDLKFLNKKQAERELSVEMCLTAVEKLKQNVSSTVEFGEEDGDRFKKGVQKVFDEVGDKSVPEKATALLYFIVHEKPFKDGNKQIGALLFVLYLTLNNHHLSKDGETKISDKALTAITLLIEESEPSERELIVDLITKLLE
ncbi:virulence protein RhuM/Fic/DOC family protein [Candidatus Saccharibacteria bacterium]|nr:virulence protein RhuM/Fic/DOC family protein [Candidatus Saccharibacteria bacterium]